MADDESFDLSGNLDDFLNEDSSAALDLGAALSSDSVSGIDSLDPIESAADLVDDEDAVDLIEDADAKTAVVAPEAEAEAEAEAKPKRNRKGLLSSFSIFDAMLVFSLLLVTAAALMMAWGLNDYGSVFGLPWKTTGITVK